MLTPLVKGDGDEDDGPDEGNPMDVILLSAACGAALLAAVAAVVRWGGLEPVPRSLVRPSADRSDGEVVQTLVRSLSIAFAAGGAAGVLTAGAGGRLMMRIMAATSSDRAQGLTTEAEETVGEITLGGTIGFLVFVGVASGLIGGLTYLALRRWLPGRSARVTGLVLGLLALAIAPATDAINRENSDFRVLDPDPLALVLILAIFLLGGMTVASVVERADRSWPEPGPPVTITKVAAYAPLLLVIPAFVVLVAFLVVVGLTLLLRRVDVLARAWAGGGVDRAGRVLVVLAVIGAVALAGAHAADILSGDDLFALGS